MNKGRYVFSQLMSFCDHNEFNRCVRRYGGDLRSRTFSNWHLLLCLVFGQLTRRSSMREIVTCLNAQGKSLYHLGLPGHIARSTFSDALNRRNCGIFRDFAYSLIQQARELYSEQSPLSRQVIGPVYALDSSLIHLCLSTFRWAQRFRKSGAIKVHTLYNIATEIPEFFAVTTSRLPDTWGLGQITPEPGTCYIMDRAYMVLEQLYRIDQAMAWFIIRPKKRMRFKRICSLPGKDYPDIRLHQIVEFDTRWSRPRYPDRIRMIKSKDSITGKTIALITNNFAHDPRIIAELYRQRWQVELFFKWIKQHLRIKVFWGQSENAVRSQIWAALNCYLLVAIMRKRLGISQNLYQTLQILSISPLSKIPLNQLFREMPSHKMQGPDSNQLSIF